MSAYLSIIRPLNGIVAVLAVYIGAFIGGAGLIPSGLFSTVLLGMLVAFLVSGGGMIINDIADATADAINRPKRAIPSGRMGKKFAIYYATVLFIIGNVIAYRFLPQQAFYVSLLATILLIAYSAKLKGIPMLSHILISFLLALAFIFGGMLHGNYANLMPLAALVFFANVGKEVYKTIDDALGDKHLTARSIALRLDIHRTRIIGNAFLYAAIVISFVPYFLKMFDEVYISFAATADVIFVVATISPAKYSSKLIKTAMFIAILAFLAGAYALRYGFRLPI